MQEHDLQQLLRDADQQAGPPPEMPLVSVRNMRDRFLRRQRRNRAVVGATAVILLLAAGTMWRAVGVSRPVANQEIHVADATTAAKPINVTESDVATLAAEADFHALVARRMIAALRQQKSIEALQRERALGDPLEQVRQELDTAAFRMIARADRILEQMGPRESAIAIYRDVIRMFPTTYSAGVAHERLAKIDQPQGDT